MRDRYPICKRSSELSVIRYRPQESLKDGLRTLRELPNQVRLGYGLKDEKAGKLLPRNSNVNVIDSDINMKVAMKNSH